MSRLALPILLAIAALFIAIPGWSAPARKETEKPLPPPTPAQFRKSQNNLKQIALAMHNYHAAYNQLPTNSINKAGKPILSWRVHILPFLEEDELYKKFKLDEPWDSENNIKLVDRMPKIYAPVRGRAEKNQTFYQMFVGKHCMLRPDGDKVKLTDITDGLANTFMVVESGKPVIWSKPDDLPFDGKSIPKLGGMFDGEFNVTMGDGYVQRIPKGVDTDALKALIGCDDGQLVNLDEVIKKAKDK